MYMSLYIYIDQFSPSFHHKQINIYIYTSNHHLYDASLIGGDLQRNRAILLLDPSHSSGGSIVHRAAMGTPSPLAPHFPIKIAMDWK